MNYTTKGNCPYCDAELSGGISGGWAGSPEMFESYKKRHNDGHPENEPKQTGKHCPNCNFLLKA